MKLRRSFLLALAALLLPSLLRAQSAKPEPGLMVTHTVNGASDLAVVPNVAVSAAEGEPVTELYV